MNEITLPDTPPPTSVEEQIRGAIYAACVYYWPTKITHGHRTVYLIDSSTYEQIVARSNEDAAAAAAERAARAERARLSQEAAEARRNERVAAQEAERAAERGRAGG